MAKTLSFRSPPKKTSPSTSTRRQPLADAGHEVDTVTISSDPFKPVDNPPDDVPSRAPELTETELKVAVQARRYKATRFPVADPTGIRIPIDRSIRLDHLTPYLKAQLKAGFIVKSDD